ncbi:YkvI family membrane protein [Anaerosacchariphilus polymeriproducens]|uniref:Transporter n=1 Tax=Anaerosacchariphilus polymeriproducens TaxID=1812858 RepID=A0A371AWF7_9FIRM|nr:hypothetical protein [Anaerosacchariphilus polymeriproducens]RDU23869.1 hypothetical protein DWV06_07240 [Anaerosacchariphilus polymeriproducens]
MNKNSISTFKVAATYIGTIVGAGFATGQEVLQFFARFGFNGLYGLILTTILFIVFGYIIMNLGMQLNANSHLEVIRFSGGKIIGTIIDIIITFFLFGALTAMIAGSGALVEEQFGLSNIIGNLLMAIITALTVLTGISGVINSISFVVPFLLISVLGISAYSIAVTPPDMSVSSTIIENSDLISNWVLSSILYISYNTVLSIAVLGPLGAQAKDKKAIKYGSILGGLGLGIGSIMIYLALFGNITEISKLEVPMIYIAGVISPIIQIIYSIVLIAEVYTTAVGSLFGFTARIVNMQEQKNKARWIVIITTVIAFFASQFGFSNLVKYMYPLVGYGGIVLLICLIYSLYQSKKMS